jgi:hypothetical protein
MRSEWVGRYATARSLAAKADRLAAAGAVSTTAGGGSTATRCSSRPSPIRFGSWVAQSRAVSGRRSHADGARPTTDACSDTAAPRSSCESSIPGRRFSGSGATSTRTVLCPNGHPDWDRAGYGSEPAREAQSVTVSSHRVGEAARSGLIDGPTRRSSGRFRAGSKSTTCAERGPACDRIIWSRSPTPRISAAATLQRQRAADIARLDSALPDFGVAV